MFQHREGQDRRRSAEDRVYLRQETGSGTTGEGMFSLLHPGFVGRKEKAGRGEVKVEMGEFRLSVRLRVVCSIFFYFQPKLGDDRSHDSLKISVFLIYSYVKLAKKIYSYVSLAKKCRFFACSRAFQRPIKSVNSYNYNCIIVTQCIISVILMIWLKLVIIYSVSLLFF